MTTESQRVADGSLLVALAHAATTQLRAWVAASWLANASATLATTLDAATRSSALAGALRTLADYTCHSFLYRWLTKEPEPDVVVIDLRETYAVGPLIALLDRLAPTLERTWRVSRTDHLFEALQKSASGEWISDSKTVRLLAAALEPPEPPDEERRE
jgi:hypothetical protein